MNSMQKKADLKAALEEVLGAVRNKDVESAEFDLKNIIAAIAAPEEDQAPVARLHIREEDDGLSATVEVLNGEHLQVANSPVDVYLAATTPAGKPLNPVEPSALQSSIDELDAWLETDGSDPLTVSQGESVGLVLQELKRLRCATSKEAAPSDAQPQEQPNQQYVNSLKKALDGWKDACADLERERSILRERLDLQYQHQKNEVWYWQHDGEDHLESMSNSMAVVIRADHLRDLVSATKTSRENQMGVNNDSDRYISAQSAAPVTVQPASKPEVVGYTVGLETGLDVFRRSEAELLALGWEPHEIIALTHCATSKEAAPSDAQPQSAFPERDTNKPAEQQGIFRKFEVRRVDGSDQPGGNHHGCRYFVLDMDHDAHAPAALRAYANSCADTHPQLSADLLAEFGSDAQQQVEQPILTPLEYRSQGREEALAIILQQEPEEALADCTKSSAIADTGDYSTSWDEDKLRELLHIGDRTHDAFGRAEAAYWEAQGHKDDAERAMRMAERAPYFKRLHDVLVKHQEWDLLHDLQASAETMLPAKPEVSARVQDVIARLGEAKRKTHVTDGATRNLLTEAGMLLAELGDTLARCAPKNDA